MVKEQQRRRVVRRAGVPVVAMVLTSLVASMLFTNPAGASAESCTALPGAFSTFHADFSNGSMKLGSATGSGLAAKACGSITIENGQFISNVQPADMSFAPVSVKLLFLSLPATITVNAPLSGPVKIAPDFSSADIDLTANMTAGAALLGFNCNIGPLKPTLTTGKSGTLTGKTFTGSLSTGFSGTVVANDFAVPGIQSSKTCPKLIAFFANLLVGLPAKPGKASITMDGSIKMP